MAEALARALREAMPSLEIRQEEPMREHTSFRIGGPAETLLLPGSAEELAEACRLLRHWGEKPLILGNGTNVLAPDEGIRGVVVLTKKAAAMALSGNTLTADCGALLTRLSSLAAESALTGLEFAYGIPGSVGGAAFMNGGAYGGEMKDVVTRVFHLTPDGEEGSLINEEAKFNYRDSAYRTNGCIITGVEFQLTPADPADIKAKMDDLLGRRKAKQPLEYPSAGSTFKRPDATHFAGALIEQCGLKGFSVGGAEVSEKHAGFIINKQGATSADVTALIREVQRRVKEQTGFELATEVILLR
jgi:UDP-N-acetylmuramate dehydrogenase